MTLCACGCGTVTPIATKTRRKYGVVRGQPHRFVNHHWSRGSGGPEHSNWRGGTSVNDGYIRVRCRDVYVPEHVLVAEAALGHALPRGALVHHRNEHRADNRGDNLVICQDRSYHVLLHARLKAYRATGDAHARQCKHCHRWARGGVDGAVATHYPRKARGGRKVWSIVHLECRKAYDRRRYHLGLQELRA